MVKSLVFVTALTNFVRTSSTVLEKDKRIRVEDAIVAGLVGDALALGSHYEYDAKKIKDKVGSYTNFHEPGKDNNGYLSPYVYVRLRSLFLILSDAYMKTV